MTTMTNDGLLAVSDLLGVQTLPLVLGIGPQQDSVEAWQAARLEAMAELRGAGLVSSYDDVTADLADALFILANPERELAARIYSESGVRQVCVARKGSRHAVATRSGDTFEVGTLWCDGGGASLARPVLDALGRAESAAIPSISSPVDELRERLDRATRSSDYADIFYGRGVAERDAIEFGLAMSSCHGHAEIVAYAYDDGVTTRTSGAVAIYDTSRGRIAASPGAAPDLRVWSTFTPGTDHRIAQAISALIETLPGGRWMP
ncbi:ESX secretion-associated protein EspG [Nocardia sp. XZ_19_385]|uniref:ESX secretion-associated protein EspG n=1 Tax=Nocardia sp. XZ_19_385 TaxID=2769488 RepID=UPI001890A40E|nr:ESX secretion-associated protein EspG [Nocardia sp. XZ_19_385]